MSMYTKKYTYICVDSTCTLITCVHPLSLSLSFSLASNGSGDHVVIAHRDAVRVPDPSNHTQRFKHFFVIDK